MVDTCLALILKASSSTLQYSSTFFINAQTVLGGLLVRELRRALSGCSPILKAVTAMESLQASSTRLKHSQYRAEYALSVSPDWICIAQRESACFGCTSLVMNLALKEFYN